MNYEELMNRAREFARTHGAAAEQTGPDDTRAFVGRALAALGDAGLLELAWLSGGEPGPEDLRRAVAVVEGLSYGSGTLASVFMVNAVFGGVAISLMGTPEQRERWLAGLRTGEIQLAFAMTEPEAGSDAASLKTEATSRDGRIVLKGEKLYTTGALGADVILVVAREAGQDDRRMSVFCVPRDAEGLTIRPMDKLAGNAQPSCHVVLKDVALPPEAVLGGAAGRGTAWDRLRATGLIERLVVAASCLGAGERILEETCAFAGQRRQFGQRIAEFQAVSHPLVEMHGTVRIMRMLLDDALDALESGRDPTVPVCTAKYWCAEQLQVIVGQSLRILGGRAYFHDHPVTRMYREAPLALYAGGTVEIQKNLIARALGL